MQKSERLEQTTPNNNLDRSAVLHGNHYSDVPARVRVKRGEKLNNKQIPRTGKQLLRKVVQQNRKWSSSEPAATITDRLERKKRRRQQAARDHESKARTVSRI